MVRRRTQVAIIGAGPSGLILAHLLRQADVDAVVLERHAKEQVLSRIRAGVLEHGTAEVLRGLGLAKRMDKEGFSHKGIVLAALGRTLRVDFEQLVGRSVIVYGQTRVQEDLYDAADARGLPVIHEAADVAVANLDGATARVTYCKDGVPHLLEADFVAGCDGPHGVCRTAIPEGARRSYEKAYPFGWLGVLATTPPVADELIYTAHERGFALCSMRNTMLSRYYIQCPLSTRLEEWTDEQFWDELRARIPKEAAARLVSGPVVEKSITPLRSLVIEPMSYQRLYLAGDAAHLVPPTGAKGLNLAVSDVACLAGALSEYYQDRSSASLEAYSTTALRRVWNAVRFSWWMTTLLHRVPDNDEFAERLRTAEFEQLFRSRASQTLLAENYVGLR